MTGLRCFHILFVPLGLLWLSCSDNIGDAGPGSETTNGIFATAVYEDGTPVKDAEVFIRPADYLAKTAAAGKREADAVTDKDGKLTVGSLANGAYNLELVVGEELAALLPFSYADSGTGLLDLGVITLRRVSAFTGVVDREAIPDSVNVYIRLMGTERVQTAGRDGRFRFAGIPAARFRLHISSSDSSLGVLDNETVVTGPNQEVDAGEFLLPADFWKDTVIVRLLLDSNRLTGMPVSRVSKMGPLGRIHEVNLTKKGIFVLPKEIKKLRLRKFHLGQNLLDSLPRELGRIQSMTHLILAGNDIKKVPVSIGSLAQLKHLDLSRNALSGLPPEIIKLQTLKFLSVSFNRLCNTEGDIKKWIDTYSSDPEWLSSQACNK